MTTSYRIETVVMTSARQDHVSDTRRSIQTLKALRSNFDLAHEVGHITLALHEPNRTGMAAARDALQLLTSMPLTPVADWPTLPTLEAVRAISRPAIPRLSLPSERLQPWQIKAILLYSRHEIRHLDHDFDHFLDKWPTSGNMRVLFREGVLVADDWLASLRLLDSLLRVFCCTVALRVASVRRLDIRTYVLVLIAVCRRYGHRAEPDDHSSLPVRRHLTCLGSSLPT